jgi:prephenate dehydratase
MTFRKTTWQKGPEAITTLYTHPQAWTQCTAFLSRLGHAERIDTSSTSKAAEIVAADASGKSAAISSKEAAELYGLDVLEEGIESVRGNVTRFLVLYKDDGVGLGERAREGEVAKTLVCFTVKHDDPGALARALGVFGKHGVNLTSINARPSLERPWHYLFFVEFMGFYVPRSETDEGLERGTNVDKAMEELEQCVERWKWCGCWKVGD